jgi:cell division protein FtsL
MDATVVLALAILFVAIVMLFAQLRMFSIDSTLKEIRDHLKGNEETPEEDKEVMVKLKL